MGDMKTEGTTAKPMTAERMRVQNAEFAIEKAKKTVRDLEGTVTLAKVEVENAERMLKVYVRQEEVADKERADRKAQQASEPRPGGPAPEGGRPATDPS